MIEHLIEKGVKKHFNGQIVLFEVASLNEHFEGLQIHDTDIVKIEQWENDELVGTEKFIKASDVNFDGAVAKEVLVKEYEDEPISETIEIIEPRVVQYGWKESDESYENSEEGTKNEPETGMPYEEAEKLINLGALIALPEWEGFWFKNLKVENVQESKVLVLTKEGEITDTPLEECKERNDWVVVEATPEQEKILDDYFASVKKPELVAELTQEEADTLIKAENAKILEMNTVNAEEVTIGVSDEPSQHVVPEVVSKTAKTAKTNKDKK